jgi:hypothetical protein
MHVLHAAVLGVCLAARDISSGHPLRLGSHYRLKDRRKKAMRDTSGRDNLCSWLFKAGILIAWCRHRPTRRKTVMTVNDKWLRALDYAHSDVLTNNRSSPRDSCLSRS